MELIYSLEELNVVMQRYLIKALELTRDEIFEVLSNKVSEYYNEKVFNNRYDKSEPVLYDRTYNLMESLTASTIKNIKNGYEFSVGWDDDYLSFQYIGNGNGGQFDALTGEEVLIAFNSGSHGYTVSGNHNYFDEALNELGGSVGITTLFKNNCRKVGLIIK